MRHILDTVAFIHNVNVLMVDRLYNISQLIKPSLKFKGTDVNLVIVVLKNKSLLQK